LIPESSRRSCLFAESCSRYVYRITKERGFIAGMRVFRIRYRGCRPGSNWIKNDISGNMELHLKDGTILLEQEVSSNFKPT